MGDDQIDKMLFSRLRRFAAAVAAAKPFDDRRRLLALEADVRSVRDGLNARCGLLVQKMNATNRQLNAVSAYARCATLRRDQSFK
ncbi:MAG: hypothetical protein JWQ94_2282 [Tardiphaga sp.]|nr:hypothetical protein [Tardiphaga sp.]